MSNRKLQEFDEYRYGPRSVLCPGDRFRVSGGPYYQNEDGSKSLMAERGTFTFRRYCVKGANKWIEANRVGGGMAVLWVGKAGPNPDLPNFKRKPYKIRKVTERKPKPGKRQGAGRPAKSAKRPAKGVKAEAGAKTGGAKPQAKAEPKPKAKAGSTPARLGGGTKRGKNGVEGGAGRGKTLPSTSGSTSI